MDQLWSYLSQTLLLYSLSLRKQKINLVIVINHNETVVTETFQDKCIEECDIIRDTNFGS